MKNLSEKREKTISHKIPLPSDWRSTKYYLFKSWDYTKFGNNSSISTAILISCMTVYRGWEGHYFNFIATDQDSNVELKVYNNYYYNYRHDTLEADDVSELYAHVLLLGMTKRFFDDKEPDLLFRSVLKYKHKSTREKEIAIPVNWIKNIKRQMDALPKLKVSIMKFLLSSTESKCKTIISELMGAEMIAFKAGINFMFQDPLTAAHTQKYVVKEMMLLKRCLINMRSLTDDERELCCLLYPGKFIPPVSEFANIAFCTVYQYKHGEVYADLIDCPHKSELKELVRSHLSGPIMWHEYNFYEKRILREIGVSQYYGSFFEEHEPLLKLISIEMETTVTYCDSKEENKEVSRLGKCEVCIINDAKYTCPKCEVKTCCLDCLKIHKKELECDGIRDKTKYIPLKKMTQMDFMSDYYFLEECTRYVADRKRDKIKKYTIYNKELPTHLFRLRAAARQRKITLRFLLSNFTKHRINTTKLNFKSQIIHWKVEWNFPNVGDKVLTFYDDNCLEGDTIESLLDKYLNPDSIIEVPGRKQLEFYQAKGIDQLKILLKAEGVRKSSNRYYELDHKLSLNENLANKTIVEFPVIVIVFEEVARELDIIQSDDEDETEKLHYNQVIGNTSGKRQSHTEGTPENIKKKRVTQNSSTKNYLFSSEIDGNSSDSSAADDGMTTEEEK
uniref:Box C/D snoRNA protein 1 n=1 Tax=Culicoides sonorensis TaxID=179676 RepID=A0A336MM05_CULSO